MSTEMVTQCLLDILKRPLERQNQTRLTICSELDWMALGQLADRHGLLPVLYHHLQRDTDLWSAVPDHLRSQFETLYMNNVQRNLHIFHQFLKLIKVLKKDAIKVILLKGVYLAHEVYGNRALRTMGDVDILVRRCDVTTVESALQSLGYSLKEWQNRDWSLKNHYHLAYTHPELHVNVEVHWDVQRPHGPYPLDIQELWHHAHPLTIAGVEVWGLSTEHLLLHHCLHIAKHGFGVGLRSFCDLAAILNRYQHKIDWQMILDRADSWHISKALHLSFYFANDFFNVSVPESVTEALKPVTIDPGMLDIAREQIFSVGTRTKGISPEFLQLWEGEQGQNKLAKILRRIFVPPDLLASNYRLSPDSWRLYLYYPVRLFDLLIRYPLTIKKLAQGDEGMLTSARRIDRVDSFRQWLAT